MPSETIGIRSTGTSVVAASERVASTDRHLGAKASACRIMSYGMTSDASLESILVDGSR